MIMHLVNANQETEKAGNEDTFSFRISNNEVKVTVKDDKGVEHAVPDLDLQIEIPREKLERRSSLKGKVKSLVNRIKGSQVRSIIRCNMDNFFINLFCF